jgi:type IV fimbrial biogenesis protein FimT
MVTRAPAARGFTLPELLVVVGIIGVLGAVAAPSISTLVANQRARSAGSELMQSLLRARSEAVKRNMEVTLRPETGSSWQSGWRIPNPSDTGHPIEVHGPVPGATFTGPASVVYGPSGRVRGSTAPSFDIAVAHASKHRCVSVDLSGRPYLKRDAC